MTRRIIKKQDGAALILTILVISMLTVIVFDFFHSAWTQTALASSYANDTKAFFAIRSGQAVARKVLMEDKRNNINRDSLDEEWAQGSIPLPIGNDYVFISIKDEAGKFNINSMTNARGYHQERRIAIFKRLLEHLKIDSNIADAIIDWLDPGSEPLPGGAEDGYYMTLKKPYRPKNSWIDSIDELYMVKGMTYKIMKKLKPHITAWSAGRINVNTATKAVLMSLDDSMTEELAKGVMLLRLTSPLNKTTDIKKVQGMAPIYPRIALDIAVKSDFYMVESSVTIGENSKSMKAVYKRKANNVKTLYRKIF